MLGRNKWSLTENAAGGTEQPDKKVLKPDFEDGALEEGNQTLMAWRAGSP
jgi:hypothetical protein